MTPLSATWRAAASSTPASCIRSSTTAHTSRCSVRTIFRGRRRAIRCWCRPAAPTTAGNSPPITPKRCSPPRNRSEEAVGYARDLKARAASRGRDNNLPLVLAGLATIIGGTEAEARQRQEQLWELIPIDYGLARLAGVLQIDRERLKLDEKLPEFIPLPANGGHTFFKATLALARSKDLTVRQLIRALNGSTGHRTIVGTPEQVADDIETWFEAGAADGFNLMPDVLPTGLAVFVDEVVPILRRRGLFRSEYEGTTLREHLGLPRPPNQFVAARAAGADRVPA